MIVASSHFKGINCLIVWTLLLLTACSTSSDHSAAEITNEPLLVAAATNVQFAFIELGQRFTELHGHPVEFSFSASGNLATQIENGAPFDVFVAANVAFVDRLSDQSLIIPETQQLYAQGRLVLAVNHKANFEITSLEDLLNPSIPWIAIANPELAPYGQAAKEALETEGLWQSLEPKVVFAENIGQTLQFVQTGDAPVGLVALAIADVPEITYTPLPSNLHAPINQAMGIVASTQNDRIARAFLEFVVSPEGQAILETYGFQPPEGL
ncbi:MAG: molybdate ABC transporter substrate-binding protein [Chloroflexota bacterium]